MIVKRDRPKAVVEVQAQLREIRLSRGMKQITLGAKCRMHGNVISGIENGLRDPTIRTLTRLAEALDCDLVVKLVPRKIQRKKGAACSVGVLVTAPS